MDPMSRGRATSSTVPMPGHDDVSEEDAFHLRNLTNGEVFEHLTREAQWFLENSAPDSLVHWAPELERAKLSKCLMSTQFVKKSIHKYKAERGCVGMLIELAKALLNLDFSRFRSGRIGQGMGPSLKTFITTVLQHDENDLEAMDSHRDLRGNLPKLDDPGVVLPELLVFLLQNLQKIGCGTSLIPMHVRTNVMDMLMEMWKNLRGDTLPQEENDNVIDAIKTLLNAWSKTPSKTLGRKDTCAQRGLTIIHVLVRRVVEIMPEVIHEQRYMDVRQDLRRLQKRLQVFTGQWDRLCVTSLHSPLPTPVLPENEVELLKSGQEGKFKSVYEEAFRKQLVLTSKPQPGTRTRLKATLEPTSSTAALSSSCSYGALDGWVRVANGRMRPWSAKSERPASPIAPTPLHSRPSSATGRPGSAQRMRSGLGPSLSPKASPSHRAASPGPLRSPSIKAAPMDPLDTPAQAPDTGEQGTGSPPVSPQDPAGGLSNDKLKQVVKSSAYIFAKNTSGSSNLKATAEGLKEDHTNWQARIGRKESAAAVIQRKFREHLMAKALDLIGARGDMSARQRDLNRRQDALERLEQYRDNFHYLQNLLNDDRPTVGYKPAAGKEGEAE